MTGPSGQPLFCHKSTHAVNFMDCVQRMASGVAMAAQTRKSRFSKSRLPNCKNMIVRLSFDFCQRRRKQGATQVRIMAPEVPSVVREPIVNFLQFGSNVTESHRDVRTDLQYISEIWDQNAARPEQFQVTAYPGCYSEQNIGVAFRPEGVPAVPGQSFGWIGFVVNDLSANQKLLGTTGVQGTDPCEVARISKVDLPNPAVFPCVDPSLPNDAGRQAFVSVMLEIVKPEVKNPKYNLLFSSEREITRNLRQYYDRAFYNNVNTEMESERRKILTKARVNPDMVEDIDQLPTFVKEPVLNHLKKFAKTRGHGFYKVTIPGGLACRLGHDNTHAKNNHGTYNCCSHTMLAFDLSSKFNNAYRDCRPNETAAEWGCEYGSDSWKMKSSLKKTLKTFLAVMGEKSGLGNVSLRLEKLINKHGENTTASKLAVRFDGETLRAYFNHIFSLNNFLMQQIELAMQVHPELDEEWNYFKEVAVCLFWDALLHREMSTLMSESTQRMGNLRRMLLGGIDLIQNFNATGWKVTYNMRQDAHT